ncbi:MAG: hypothetical protein ACQESE_03295 [Nanobdellota archaeon]
MKKASHLKNIYVLDRLREYQHQLNIKPDNMIDVVPYLAQEISDNRYKTLGQYLHSRTQHIDQDIATFDMKSVIYLHPIPKKVTQNQRYILIRDVIGKLEEDEQTRGIYRRIIVDNNFSEFIDNKEIALNNAINQTFFKNRLRNKRITIDNICFEESTTYTHFILDTDHFLDTIHPLLIMTGEIGSRDSYHIVKSSSKSRFKSQNR